MDLSSIIENNITLKDGIWYSGNNGYWSLLNHDKMQKILSDLSDHTCLEFVRENIPQWEDLIFSLKRAAGVGMLDIRESDIVVDIGCMWGALTVPIARTDCKVIGIDQTKESLLFHSKRLNEENLTNVDLVCADARELSFKKSSVDKFIVNGVLEWIPESVNVAFEKDHLKKDKNRNIIKKIFKYYKNGHSPLAIQRSFLSKLNKALKKNGTLYLAIENRFDIHFFLGGRDPHTDFRFINILPRFLQIPYSFLLLGRPFLTWIYSENELKELLYLSGFSKVEIMYAFPDYQFPELILSAKGMAEFTPVRYGKSKRKIGKIIWWFLETFFYKSLKAKSLSPAFVVIAHK